MSRSKSLGKKSAYFTAKFLPSVQNNLNLKDMNLVQGNGTVLHHGHHYGKYHPHQTWVVYRIKSQTLFEQSARRWIDRQIDFCI